MTIIHMIILVLMPSMALMALLLCKRSFVRDKSFHIQSGPPLRSAGGRSVPSSPETAYRGMVEWVLGVLVFGVYGDLG